MNKSSDKWWQGDKSLRTAGELVSGGGLAGALMTLLYVILGIVIWSLVGYGLDRLLGTSWIVWLGLVVGACGGFYLVYYHMQNSNK
ncbi:MAG: AtpZ/AtpI family protein [Rothia sp. (in: high G+C Gram-positive bacteria)]|nr:AtpZ/AtpI family protein [Rothia sp. (in: high G+C Gram-positive bacteria)]